MKWTGGKLLKNRKILDFPPDYKVLSARYFSIEKSVYIYIQKNVSNFVPFPEFFTTGIPLFSILPAYKCQIGKSMMICVIFLWRAKAGANTEI